MDAADTKASQPVTVPRWRVVVFGRRPRATLARIVVVAIILLTVRFYVMLPVRVQGVSMEPTYRNGSFNFVCKSAYWFREPQRGDVVGYGFTGPHAMLFKRIIAVPGETVEIRRGVVHINGEPLEEPYVEHRRRWNVTPRTMGPGEYFLIGDNRGMPQQDHDFGRGSRKNIVGKAFW